MSKRKIPRNRKVSGVFLLSGKEFVCGFSIRKQGQLTKDDEMLIINYSVFEQIKSIKQKLITRGRSCHV